MTPEHKHLLKTWVAAGLWLLLIAIESTAYLSAFNTGRFLYPIFHFLFGMDRAHFHFWHMLLRKCGHFVGYLILSALLFRAWKDTLRLRSLWAMRWAAIAFLMSAFVASMDEWHQTYIPARTGTIRDVMLDSAAALTAQIVIFYYWRSRSSRMAQQVIIGS